MSIKETTNKNGYEIRTDILAMAKDFILNDYWSKREMWLNTVSRDEQGRIIDAMSQPSLPKMQDVLDTASAFYSFVNSSPNARR
jgi:hypothetical protein